MLGDDATLLDLDGCCLVSIELITEKFSVLISDNLTRRRQDREETCYLIHIVKDGNDDGIILHLIDGSCPIPELIPSLILIRSDFEFCSHLALSSAGHIYPELARITSQSINSTPDLVELVYLASPSLEDCTISR